MRAVVLGYGVSGKAAFTFLQKMGAKVVALDQSAEKRSEGALLDSADFSLKGFDLMVVSPGIEPTHPLIIQARQEGIEVASETALGLRYLKNRAFGITGTNGKTTTVLLSSHILQSAGKKGVALGNVGIPLTHHLLQIDPDEIVILELSSFQLEGLNEPKLEAAFILNIKENHLDRHTSYEEYVLAKMQIANCLQKGGDLFVSSEVQKEFGQYFKKATIFEKNLAPIEELVYTQLEMPSKQSIEASYLLCKRCGVTDIEFLQGLKTFQKPKHRIEWVAKINGVTYYDDSKSSNVESVIHAVSRIDGPIVLIVGGMHKGASYKPWVEAFEGKVRMVIAYGKAANLIECEIASHIPFMLYDRFVDAVECAKREGRPNETVLFSPGCSSFDQFANYQERGFAFQRLVKGVTG